MLQAQLAFQDEAVATLDKALSEQQREILLLRRQMELLVQRQRDFEARRAGDDAPPVDETPPHY